MCELANIRILNTNSERWGDPHAIPWLRSLSQYPMKPGNTNSWIMIHKYYSATLIENVIKNIA